MACNSNQAYGHSGAMMQIGRGEKKARAPKVWVFLHILTKKRRKTEKLWLALYRGLCERA